MRDDLLIVDDLMLLLMDDDGASVQGAGTLYYTLGGAVLTELALLGRIQTDDTGVMNGPRVTPSGEGPLPDPLLQSAHDTVAEKTRRVQPLLVAIGADLAGGARPARGPRPPASGGEAHLRRVPEHEVAGCRSGARSTAAGPDPSDTGGRRDPRPTHRGDHRAAFRQRRHAHTAPAAALDVGDGDAGQGARAWPLGIRGGRQRG